MKDPQEEILKTQQEEHPNEVYIWLIQTDDIDINFIESMTSYMPILLQDKYLNRQTEYQKMLYNPHS